jgi:hypothetical protein
MRQFLLIPVLCFFCLALPQQPTTPPAQGASPTTQSTADQLAEDTKWVLDNFNSFLAKFDAAVAAGQQITFSADDAKLLAIVHKKAFQLAGQWQAIFDSFGTQHSAQDTLEKNPKYEKALIFSQEMMAISGAAQANLSLLIKPHYSQEIARNAIDYMGIVRRMEAIR